MAQPPSETSAEVQFLLAEMENMRQFKAQSDLLSDRRADVLITLTSALGTGLIILYQILPDKSFILPVALAATGSVLAIGLITLRQITKAEFYSTEYIRAINCIRAYFVANAPHIKPYLLMSLNGNFPRFSRVTRNRSVALLINTILMEICAIILTFYIRQDYTIDLIDGSIFIGVFIIVSLGLSGYMSFLDRRAERSTQKNGEEEQLQN
jgi:general stress protein CsbA